MDYLFHLYALVPLALFAVGISSQTLVEKTVKVKKNKGVVHPMVFVYTLSEMVSFMLVQGMWSNLSIWITQSLGGTLVQAGLASSIMSLFSFFGRLAFGSIYNKLGRYTPHLNILLLIIGMFIVSSAISFTHAIIAIAFVGLAMGFVATVALNRCIEISPESQENAQAVTSIGFALGNFASTYWQLCLRKLENGSIQSIFNINTYFRYS